MKLKASSGEFSPAPAGTHIAVCCKFIDLGTQQIDWQGQSKLQRKVMIAWELTNETMQDGRPFIISQRYTFSTSDKATFRKHLEAWRGKAFTDADFGDNGFDTKRLLGVPCSLIVAHKTVGDKTYANVTGIGPIPKGVPRPEPVNELVYFSLEAFSREVFDSLSDGLKETISKSPEYAQATNMATADHHETNADFDDEIPFNSGN